MKDIRELLAMEKEGKPLTIREQSYLDNYKKTKHFRHATSFTYHARKLPKDTDVK